MTQEQVSLEQEYQRAAEALLAHVENGTTDQAAAVMTVPAATYTDADQWAREMEMIFHRLPLMLALSAEMPAPGDYKAMDAMGKPVLLTRGKDGDVRAFLNVCAHRGGAVAAEGHGNCTRFSCIYHGWTYASDGRLLAVADKAKFGDLDRDAHGLTALPVAERAGLIFVCLTPDANMDIDTFLGGILPDLEHCDLASHNYAGSREIFGANWKVAYDGYLEGYHFAAAHPETIHTRTHSNVMHFDCFGPHMRTGYAQKSIGKLRDVPRAQWGRMENDGYDYVRTLFPNISIFVAPEIVQVSQLFPGPTADRNRTVLHFLTKEPPKDEEAAAGVEQMIRFLRDVVDEEDYALGLKVQKGLESGAIDHVTFGRNEKGNQLFHKYVDFYVAGGEGAPPLV